ENGNIFEKGGVNFSAVFGKAPEFLLKETDDSASKGFFATGVSLVIHPVSPMVPIIHMNIRYLELTSNPLEKSTEDKSHRLSHWFGGGIDLTPVYIVEDDKLFFHQQLRSTCDKFDSAFYSRFKQWADDY